MISNTPIKELIELYENESCNFSDVEQVIKDSLRYVQTIEDSHVRCLLYVLSNKLKESERVKSMKYKITINKQNLKYQLVDTRTREIIFTSTSASTLHDLAVELQAKENTAQMYNEKLKTYEQIQQYSS